MDTEELINQFEKARYELRILNEREPGIVEIVEFLEKQGKLQPVGEV